MELESPTWGKLSCQSLAWVFKTFPFLPKHINLIY